MRRRSGLSLEVVELGYDHLELGTDLEPARTRLDCAMARHDALLDQVHQHLLVAVADRPPYRQRP